MATPVGHSIAGAGLAYLFGVNPIIGAVVANIPDLIGHGKPYKYGHSLLLEGAIGLLLSLVLGNFAWLIILLSHIVLDCCYEGGVGLACLWPFSDKSVSLGKFLLLMDSKKPFGEQSWLAYQRELEVIGFPMLILVLIRMFT